ncbi:hypothetical protein [Microseira wollei]|uniref:Uncharacterized protein n=1 Tax=Microseira wollei NIES-4236 TaxID=2530354 RepID=A0AAV3XKH4_9CYAN|nr:hypothetical protein [Microseira wollei]GET42813.1 hypothetical protein MiSe_76310 [Microseira wollei NIES-4236]
MIGGRGECFFTNRLVAASPTRPVFLCIKQAPATNEIKAAGACFFVSKLLGFTAFTASGLNVQND